MANDSRTCSISHQDCATLYTFPGSSIPFTNTSCVPYTPWVTGDVGICGWVGAPCETAGTGSNCNLRKASVCIAGVCGGGLGEQCPDLGFCNGVIRCGDDGICGGENAQVSSPTDNIRKFCVSGRARVDSTGGLRCTSQPERGNGKQARAKIIGGVFGGLILLAILLGVFIWFLRRRRQSGKEDRAAEPFVSERPSTAPVMQKSSLPSSFASRFRSASNTRNPSSVTDNGTITEVVDISHAGSIAGNPSSIISEKRTGADSQQVPSSSGAGSSRAANSVTSSPPSTTSPESVRVVYVMAAPHDFNNDAAPPPYERP